MSARDATALLSERAARVAEQDREVRAAFAEERQANEALLRAALIACAPAVRALSSRIGSFDQHGVAVGEAPAGPVLDADRRVLYACPGAMGIDVVLREGLVRGGEVVWLAQESVAEVASRYRAEDVLGRLLRKCEEQLAGNARRRGAEALERAERLRCLRLVVEALSS